MLTTNNPSKYISQAEAIPQYPSKPLTAYATQVCLVITSCYYYQDLY